MPSDESMTNGGSRCRYILAASIVILFAVSIIFRIIWLNRIPGINGDEAWLGWKAFETAKGCKLDWTTNSGNLTDPFYILPLIGLHYLLEPSGWLLRSVAVLSGVLVLVVNYILSRALLGRRAALVSTILLAVLPVNIAYSRFGWEPSQIVLFSLPIVYCSIALADKGRMLIPWLIALAVSLLCAVLVHPTSAFLALFPVLGFSARWVQPEKSPFRLFLLFGIGTLAATLLGASMYVRAPLWVHDEIAHRLISGVWISDAPHFLLAWIRNYNGINTFGFLPASWPGSSEVLNINVPARFFVLDWVILVILFLSIVIILIPGSGKSSDKSAAQNMTSRISILIVTGWVLATCLFGVMNGSGKTAVWFDRYGLWAVAPTVLMISMAYSILGIRFGKFRMAVDSISVFACYLFLALFWQKYFVCFLTTGGHSGLDSRVGATEMKEKAADELYLWQKSWDGCLPRHTATLVSSDWYVYWAVIYFLRRNERDKGWDSIYAKVDPNQNSFITDDIRKKVSHGDVAVVEYEGSPSWKQWDEIFPDKDWDRNSISIGDTTDKPTLRLELFHKKEGLVR